MGSEIFLYGPDRTYGPGPYAYGPDCIDPESARAMISPWKFRKSFGCLRRGLSWFKSFFSEVGHHSAGDFE